MSKQHPRKNPLRYVSVPSEAAALKGSSLHVYLALLSMAEKPKSTRVIVPTSSRKDGKHSLCSLTKLSQSSVQRAIKELIDAGFVEAHRQHKWWSVYILRVVTHEHPSVPKGGHSRPGLRSKGGHQRPQPKDPNYSPRVKETASTSESVSHSSAESGGRHPRREPPAAAARAPRANANAAAAESQPSPSPPDPEDKLAETLRSVFSGKTQVGPNRWENALVVKKIIQPSLMSPKREIDHRDITIGLIGTNDGPLKTWQITIGEDDAIRVPLDVVLTALKAEETNDWVRPMLALFERTQESKVRNPAGLYRKMVVDVVDGHRPKKLRLVTLRVMVN